MNRRDLFRAALGLVACPAAASERRTQFAPVVPGHTLRFPQDEGSHPPFRIEWWYVTGWLDTSPAPHGFQVTFFRTSPWPDTANPSRFAPRHILIAHAALSDPRYGRLRHAQRSARAGFGLAEAALGATNVWIDDWSLRAQANAYTTRIEADDFALDLRLDPTQPPLLHGEGGFSRKGPAPEAASYYYSLPQLRVAGRLRVDSTTREVSGVAWLDHEWSSQIMDAQAVGWDWTGINLDDGGALMAFTMRRAGGGIQWAAATRRDVGANPHPFAPGEVQLQALRRWKSPRTGASYPVESRLRVAGLELDLVALMDDQENDARLSTGTVYWEGAVSAMSKGERVGRGYLELTGYAQPLRL